MIFFINVVLLLTISASELTVFASPQSSKTTMRSQGTIRENPEDEQHNRENERLGNASQNSDYDRQDIVQDKRKKEHQR